MLAAVTLGRYITPRSSTPDSKPFWVAEAWDRRAHSNRSAQRQHFPNRQPLRRDRAGPAPSSGGVTVEEVDAATIDEFTESRATAMSDLLAGIIPDQSLPPPPAVPQDHPIPDPDFDDIF